MHSHTQASPAEPNKTYNAVICMQPYVDCIVFCLYSKEDIRRDAWYVPLDHVPRSIDRSSLYFCGFPTLQHIKHTVGVPSLNQGVQSVCHYTLKTCSNILKPLRPTYLNKSSGILWSLFLVLQEEEWSGRVPAKQQRREHYTGNPSQ